MPSERENRIKKLNTLREMGVDPYPPRTNIDRIIAKAIEDFDNLVQSENPIDIAGRLIAFRAHGGSSFAHIRDGSAKIQLYFRRDVIGEESYNILKKLVDIGDFIEVKGTLFTTRTGEKTLQVKEWKLLSKSLLPLPEKWHGLSDDDLKVRLRYLDAVIELEIKKRFEKRSTIIDAIRNYLKNEGYLEVETPILQPLYGGASARPFKTKHNALDLTLFLRVAEELYLKRMIVAGFDRVFEIGRNFRNEGMDRLHNPEFTMLELYEAYGDYNRMMDIAEEMLVKAATALENSTEISYGGKSASLETPFERIGFYDALKKYAGLDAAVLSDHELRDEIERREIAVRENATRWQLIDELFSELVEPHLIAPIFVLNYPVALSPLAKQKAQQPDIVERFELFFFGMEIANAFTELNDPLEQRRRFEAQMELRAKGDPEAQVLDEDFLTAMEHGMPPTGGLGVGVDRLAMILTDSHSIRDVIFFPLNRPSAGERN